MGTPLPEAEHGSTQEPPLQVLGDRLFELDISKMAKSQENPYMHRLDEEVHQLAEPTIQEQPLPDKEPLCQDLPNIDHMSELKGEDFKAFEAIKEREHVAAKALQQIHEKEQSMQQTDKGKAKVEG